MLWHCFLLNKLLFPQLRFYFTFLMQNTCSITSIRLFAKRMYIPQNYEHMHEKLVVLIRQADYIGSSHMDTSIQSNWAIEEEEISQILAISYFTYLSLCSGRFTVSYKKKITFHLEKTPVLHPVFLRHHSPKVSQAAFHC